MQKEMNRSSSLRAAKSSSPSQKSDQREKNASDDNAKKKMLRDVNVYD